MMEERLYLQQLRVRRFEILETDCSVYVLLRDIISRGRCMNDFLCARCECVQQQQQQKSAILYRCQLQQRLPRCTKALHRHLEGNVCRAVEPIVAQVALVL